MLSHLLLLLNNFGAFYRVCEFAVLGCEKAAGPGSEPDYILTEPLEASNVKCSSFAVCSSDKALTGVQNDW